MQTIWKSAIYVYTQHIDTSIRKHKSKSPLQFYANTFVNPLRGRVAVPEGKKEEIQKLCYV